MRSTTAPPPIPTTITTSSTSAHSTLSKRLKIESLERRLHELETENASLKNQLKTGKEPVSLDDQSRLELTDKISQVVGDPNTTELAMKALLKEYVIKYSDYGTDRARIVDKLMDQLDRLLAPTQLSKLCMWSLHQEEDFFRIENSLWLQMVKEIEADEEQQLEFQKYRKSAMLMTHELRFTNKECQELRLKLRRKNKALGEEMGELSKVLTPKQMARFISFVSNNHASAVMLSRLWDSELKRVMAAAASAAAASSAAGAAAATAGSGMAAAVLAAAAIAGSGSSSSGTGSGGKQ